METENQENTSIKDLREAAERGRKASSELDAMKREMAFLKAGVDLEKKAGQLLMKAYDGDLEPELIRAEAEELGAIVGPAPTPVEEVQEIDTSTAERQALVQDSVAPEATTESPYDRGHREFQEMLNDGRPKEDAAARFVHTVLEAAGQGDERVTNR
tara:strand:- start:593 stop:1063 length:471 start_codon:yes stop_codon:yes gene_type:complete